MLPDEDDAVAAEAQMRRVEQQTDTHGDEALFLSATLIFEERSKRPKMR